jgi:hypothetical protein
VNLSDIGKSYKELESYLVDYDAVNTSETTKPSSMIDNYDSVMRRLTTRKANQESGD